MMWGASLFAGFAWLTPPFDYYRWLFTGVWLLLVVAAASYDTGYKRIYKRGGRTYFVLVYILPLSLGFAGMLIGIYCNRVS